MPDAAISPPANQETTYLDPSTLYEAYYLLFRQEKCPRIDAHALLSLESFLWAFIVSDVIYVPYRNAITDAVVTKLAEHNCRLIKHAVENSSDRKNPLNGHWVYSCGLAYTHCREDVKKRVVADIWSKVYDAPDTNKLFAKLQGAHSQIPKLYGFEQACTQYSDKDQEIQFSQSLHATSHGLSTVQFFRGITEAPMIKGVPAQIAYHMQRTMAHLYFSKYLNAHYVVHPVRQPYLVWKEKEARGVLQTLLDKESRSLLTRELDVISYSKRISEKVNSPLPPLTLYLLSSTSSREDLIDVLLEIRASKAAVSLRSFQRQLQAAEDMQDYMKFRRELVRLQSVLDVDWGHAEAKTEASLKKQSLAVVPELTLSCIPSPISALNLVSIKPIIDFMLKTLKNRKFAFISKIKGNYTRDIIKSKELIEKHLGCIDEGSVQNDLARYELLLEQKF